MRASARLTVDFVPFQAGQNDAVGVRHCMSQNPTSRTINRTPVAGVCPDIDKVRFRLVCVPAAGYVFAIDSHKGDFTPVNDRIEKAAIFKSLHVKGDPLVLYNVWDAGSAEVVADAGAKAIATASWAVAAANGFQDGEKLPLELALCNVQRIIDAVNLPVSMDLESGYGQDPSGVADTVTRAIELGAVGFNLEDQIMGANALYDTGVQAARIDAARGAADALGVPAFINARTDVFMQAGAAIEDDRRVGEVLGRAKAYQQAGADGFFVPGLVDETAIEALCNGSPLPVNIMMFPGSPSRERLAKLGVARISHGPGAYRTAMETIRVAARSIYS